MTDEDRETFLSIPPAKATAKKAALYLFTAVASCLAALITAWSSASPAGMVTRSELERVEAKADAAMATANATANALGQPSEVEAREPIAVRMRTERDARVRLEQQVGLEVRTRVGLQVAAHVGMDPKRKRAAEQAAVNARAKYDELVLRYPPDVAADKVLEMSRVPR